MKKQKGIRSMKHKIMEARLENAEMEIARYPSPFITIEWAGRTMRAVSSSGAPINVEGIISWNVWEMAAETIKRAR